jgi:hypothetical protein
MLTEAQIGAKPQSITPNRVSTSVLNGMELDILSDDYAEAEELFSVEYPCTPINRIVWLCFTTHTILINGAFKCQLFYSLKQN